MTKGPLGEGLLDRMNLRTLRDDASNAANLD
jgi:hypothetical protein